MTHATKRHLLAGAALLMIAAAPSAQKPPAARVDNDSDVYFGKRITDPYRWMEADGPELTQWAQAQNLYTRAVLARIPGRDALLRHMNEVSSHMVIVSDVGQVGHRLFFIRRDVGDELGKLVLRETDGGAERVLIDPNKMTQNGHHVSIDQFQPSQDGHYVAVGISPSGSEEDVLHVVDADTGEMLPDNIDRARFASPSWLPDNRSFFYNRLHAPTPHEAPSERFANNRVFLHHLGDNPDQDIPVFGAAVGDLKTIAPHDFVAVLALAGTRYAIGVQSDGVSPEIGLYISALPSGGGTNYAWRQIATPAAGIVEITSSRDTLYLRTHLNASRYRIASVPLDAPDISKAKEIVPQGPGVLTNIAAAADGLYVAGRLGAASFLRQVGDDGKITDIKLPMTGSIGAGDLSADPRTLGATFGIATWVTPSIFYSVGRDDPHAVMDLKLAPAPDAGDYVITETSVVAKDGRTKLPLSIIEKKGTPHDHNRPVLVEGYGAYGISEEPFARLVPVVRGWVDAGGVMAVSHVRGGGELGEDWHLAGKKVTKQNSIQDFIDSAWAMTKLGYTGNTRLAATGTSAGGITVGGAITQLPSLFRAALIRVGAVNPLRFETTEGGPANVPEFGTVQDPKEFNYLLAMDAYQHVKQAVAYPAVMLTAGASDHRVPLWGPAKMAARLQAAGARAKGPILLRVDEEGGHGTIGATETQANSDWADGFAFLLWQLGEPGFQPTK